MSDAPRQPVVRHRAVQAPVRALDADGSVVVAVGTIGFAIASVVLGLLLPQLDAAGLRWWWHVALTATGLGALGWVGVRLRRR